MIELLLTIALLLLMIPAALLLCAGLFSGSGPNPEWRDALTGNPRQIIDTGSLSEPCWSEALGRDSNHVYARAQCPDDLLMEMDERARRQDFPIPLASQI